MVKSVSLLKIRICALILIFLHVWVMFSFWFFLKNYLVMTGQSPILAEFTRAHPDFFEQNDIVGYQMSDNQTGFDYEIGALVAVLYFVVVAELFALKKWAQFVFPVVSVTMLVILVRLLSNLPFLGHFPLPYTNGGLDTPAGLIVFISYYIVNVVVLVLLISSLIKNRSELKKFAGGSH